MLMMGAPHEVSLQRIQQELEALPDVRNIHHVHVWRMSGQDIHFEAHVDVADMPVSACQQISTQIKETLHDLYEITHVTLQFECNVCELKGVIYNHQSTQEEDSHA